MQWEINILTSVTLLAVLQGNEVSGVSQENSYVIECIRDMIPAQVYSDCCTRDTNCTISKQQNRAIDCMSRMIMTNYSSLFSDSRESGPGTTDMNFSNTRNQRYNDVLDTLSEICRRHSRSRLQTCIRNELIKRCRYSMLQDRFTSSPGRWGQRRSDMDSGYNDNYGHMEPRRRTQFFNGGRRPQDGFIVMGRPMDYNSESRHSSSRGGYSDASDDEDFGYSSESDSMRFK